MVPGYVDMPEELENTFSAVVKIKFLVKQSTKAIVLNMNHLSFSLKPSQYTVYEDLQSQLNNNVVDLVVDAEKECVTFVLENVLEQNKNYTIEIFYNGVISANRLNGLYSTSYQTASGKTRYIATTQMESVGAREMVPCFDEPAYKAIWKVRIIHPLHTNALSNGQQTQCQQKDRVQMTNDFRNILNISSFIMTCYEDTPKMSSYLIAVVVSDYVSQESTFQTLDNRSVVVRVWSQPEQIESTNLALKAGLAAIVNLESLFKIPYPLPKIDMISVPAFDAGAMENWGLIIFKEEDFLCRECENWAYISDVIAHELTHQWFGNLVTMKWWNDVFLNEGFAEFFEAKVSLAAANNTSYSEAHLKEDRITAMQNDCFSNSTALSGEITDAEQDLANNAYNKARASIFRMFEKVKGSNNFLSLLRQYLNAHKYSNAGYPIVTVQTIDSQHVELSQQSCNAFLIMLSGQYLFSTHLEEWNRNDLAFQQVNHPYTNNKTAVVINPDSYGYYVLKVQQK
uniref:Aminopeptidase N n=1 Tax=Ditylenchus dipsaci TaxID=166011 RepID=A0A915DV06_9BILA